MSLRLLLIDNYDSFVFNAHHLFQATLDGIQVDVVRNDDPFLPALERGDYHGVVIGPGPGSPEDKTYFGHCTSVIVDFAPQGLPVLGICLGFQGIYALNGGQLKFASIPMHGKVSPLKIHQPGVLLEGVDSGVLVMRYHSIMADSAQGMPDCFDYTAYVMADGEQDIQGHGHVFANKDNGQELMSLEHKSLPLFGVQFHPESFATECGGTIAQNFVRHCLKLK